MADPAWQIQRGRNQEPYCVKCKCKVQTRLPCTCPGLSRSGNGGQKDVEEVDQCSIMGKERKVHEMKERKTFLLRTTRRQTTTIVCMNHGEAADMMPREDCSVWPVWRRTKSLQKVSRVSPETQIPRKYTAKCRKSSSWRCSPMRCGGINQRCNHLGKRRTSGTLTTLTMFFYYFVHLLRSLRVYLSTNDYPIFFSNIVHRGPLRCPFRSATRWE